MGMRIDPLTGLPENLLPQQSAPMMSTPPPDPMMSVPPPMVPAPVSVSPDGQSLTGLPPPTAVPVSTGVPPVVVAPNGTRIATAGLSPEGQQKIMTMPGAEKRSAAYGSRIEKIQNDIAAGKKEAKKGLSEIEKIQNDIANDRVLNPTAEDIAAEQAREKARIEDVSAKKGTLDDAVKAKDKHQFKDYWTDKTMGDKALAGIAIMLGAVGQGFAGGENMGMKAVNAAIERDTQLQRDNYNKLKDAVGEAKDSYSQAMQMLKDGRAADAFVKAQKWEGINNRVALARAQTTDAEKLAGFDKMLADIELKKQEQQMVYNEALMKQYQEEMKNDALRNGDDGKPATQDQYSNAGFGTRMASADKAIRQLEDGKYGATATKAGLKYSPSEHFGTLTALRPTQSSKSDERQIYETAKMDFIRAVLRKQSGATISPQEFEDEDKLYFPVPGDSQKTIEYKRGLRERAISSFKAAAGKAWGQVEAQNPQTEIERKESKYK